MAGFGRGRDISPVFYDPRIFYNLNTYFQFFTEPIKGNRHNRWIGPLDSISKLTNRLVLKSKSYLPFLLRALWETCRFKPHVVISIGPDLVAVIGILISKLIFHRPFILFLGGDPIAVRQEWIDTINKTKILTKYKHILLAYINSHYVYKTCYHFMVNSYYLRSRLLISYNHFKNKHISVVPQAMTMMIRSKKKVPQNWHKFIRMLTVTNLAYQAKYEGVLELVDFLCRYVEHMNLNTKFYFSICAGGHYHLHLRKKLQEVTSKQNRLCISYSGFIDNLESIYKNSHIFLYCSNHDSLPRVLLEAQAHGLPTLVNDFDPFREVVTHGYNGLIYRTGDFEDFKEKLDTLITKPDLYYSLSKNALENLEKHYSVNAIGKRLRKVLLAVARHERYSR